MNWNCPPNSFDVAHFSRVLMYLREPECALQLAFRSLKPGGMVTACDAYGAGDWIVGPHAESITLLTRVLREDNNARGGGDALIGGGSVAFFKDAGFVRIAGKPNYSAALSDPKALAAVLQAGWSSNLRPILIRNVITLERCNLLIEDISVWGESEDSISA
jgi:SAM-dependent methyltransferase